MSAPRVPRTVIVRGWSIRDYAPGDFHATIFCPHGRPVEVINTDSKPINPTPALEEWLTETAEWRRSYCEGHGPRRGE